MHKKMTITLDEAVYEGLWRTIGKRRMSQFIEDLYAPMSWAHPWKMGTRPWRKTRTERPKPRNGQTLCPRYVPNKTRLKGPLGSLSKIDMLSVEDAIKVHLGMPR